MVEAVVVNVGLLKIGLKLLILAVGGHSHVQLGQELLTRAALSLMTSNGMSLYEEVGSLLVSVVAAVI